MLDSVLIARDKWLKPGGAMFPSHATLYLGPLGPMKALQDKWQLWEREEQHWGTFTSDMKNWYETDFSSVHDEFKSEQRKYYLQTSAFANITPKQLIGPAKPLMELDLLTTSVEELQAPARPLICTMRIVKDAVLEGFCGFF